jgi:hypothetical protein
MYAREFLHHANSHRMNSFKYTWPNYLPSAPHAAILVIDASNAETFSNTRKVLHDICAHRVRID